jgi:hypothetical protein
MLFNDSGQLTSFKPFNNLSAYFVIFKTHWRIGFLITGNWPRSETILPSTIKTSSLANTVPSSSHQLTSMSLISANPSSKSLLKIHCVHL